MSIRTFYLFFATKDDLLLAIHETILASEVEPRLRKRCDAEPDSVIKLKVYIEALFKLTGSAAPVTRAFMVQQHRLAEARPNDLDNAMLPQIRLVGELIQNAADAGRLRPNLDVERAVQLFHQLVLGVIEARVLGSERMGYLTPDQVWDFCASAIGADQKGKPARRTSSRI